MATKNTNVNLAYAMMSQFTPQDPKWCEGLHDSVVMEFPFGATLGLPPRIEGKAACAALFQAAAASLHVAFHDLKVQSMADADYVLAEYGGRGHFKGKPYNQRYATLMQFRDGKLIFYREYFDTQIAAETFGHLSALTEN